MLIEILSRIRESALDRELRTLQRKYYEGDPSDHSVILEYLETLRKARASTAEERSSGPMLHLGCGEHRLEGWINVDYLVTEATDVQTDVGNALPFRSDSVAFIHSEDLLEHLDLENGRTLLAECHRVLVRGGVMRILTPDLDKLIEHVYRQPQKKHLTWCKSYLGAVGPCEALNMHLRMDGEHRFIYDSTHLRKHLTTLGFDVYPVSYNKSTRPQLRYLDLRDFGLNIFFEAVKR